MSEKTILDLYRHDAAMGRTRHYVHHTPDGERALGTDDFLELTARLAAWLAGRGIGKGDRVMLLSNNRPEWHIVDLAVLSLRAVDVPVYATLTPAQIEYQANDSGARIAVAEDAEQMAKFLEIRDACPGIETLLQIEGEPAEGVIAMDGILAGGGEEGTVEGFWERAAQVQADDLATIVYTSGTTGNPKGVMLTHGNFVSNVLAAIERAPIGPGDHVLEFLPLSHVLERCVAYAYMLRGCTRAYCAPQHVGDLLATVAPTAFVSVPRLYEKIHATIMGKVEKAPALRRKLFHWAVERGRRASACRLAGRDRGLLLSISHGLADRIVLSKIRQALGGRVRYSLSGGAPLPVHLATFFHALGMPVHEGYGLTETSPAITVSGYDPGWTRLGSVGRPLDNLEIKLDDDGELLVRGPSVMQGYWNKPEQTAEVFDEEGFFRTGDIARIDEDGFVYITDRKKDLIVTAGGKNVAPQPIEGEIARSRFVDNVVLIGDGRPYIVALVSPMLEELQTWARDRGIAHDDEARLLAADEVERLFDRRIARVNSNLAPYEQIKKFRVLPMQLTVDNGYLTPTMKVKRRVIARDYAKLIKEMY
jgi:long-chain acyl-CoA synthetase